MRALSKAEGIKDYFTKDSLNPHKIKDEVLFQKFTDRYDAFNMVLYALNDEDRIHAMEYIRRQDKINPVKYYDGLTYRKDGSSSMFGQALDEVGLLVFGALGFERDQPWWNKGGIPMLFQDT